MNPSNLVSTLYTGLKLPWWKSPVTSSIRRLWTSGLSLDLTAAVETISHPLLLECLADTDITAVIEIAAVRVHGAPPQPSVRPERWRLEIRSRQLGEGKPTPAQRKCQINKDKKAKKTLVCVASRFYPDHVTVLWQIDGVNVTEGVATDDAALWGGDHYSISSRLTVPLRDWFTPGRTFTCTVSFFNGSHTVPRSDWVQGPGASPIREKYLRITQIAKLFYAILISKSSVFGVFVVVLVWRLQGSSGKQRTEG
ncbi:hypothetical protein FQN60_003466 [Etheostoma spectabile]|uniref:Ig-like domain-containing protein n=1 Tax=Etheostoma spectabile TaxID=54343 RepID=A0A5J5CRF6_9PERO|nr:hypothetical protein FQN60_003466 [Etheostoma spectabile]